MINKRNVTSLCILRDVKTKVRAQERTKGQLSLV